IAQMDDRNESAHEVRPQKGRAKKSPSKNGRQKRARPKSARAKGNQENLEARVWLRMLACANLVESSLRERMAREFDTTLARFDVLAQLARPPEQPTMGEL